MSVTGNGDTYHQCGTGVRQNNEEALRWLARAAEAGDGRAMANLGFLYAAGIGTTRDPAKAVSWFRAGAKAGDLRAMTMLGEMLLKGDGVPVDVAEGRRWITTAAQGGDGRAMAELGLIHLGDQRNAEAVKWLSAGRDQLAMYHLGVLYATGTGGVPKDLPNARSLWRAMSTAGGVDILGTGPFELGTGLDPAIAAATRKHYADSEKALYPQTQSVGPGTLIAGAVLLAFLYDSMAGPPAPTQSETMADRVLRESNAARRRNAEANCVSLGKMWNPLLGLCQ